MNENADDLIDRILFFSGVQENDKFIYSRNPNYNKYYREYV